MNDIKQHQQQGVPDFKIMGVINITPDSFSDGGKFIHADHAKAHAELLINQGANILDVGAESSRPGSKFVSEKGEWERLKPILKALAPLAKNVEISVDTRKPTIMLKALEYGVHYINNIDGLCDDDTLRTLAKSNVHYIAMHMHKNPETMQVEPLEGKEAVNHVRDFYKKAHDHLYHLGFTPNRIWLDPGLGFGKDDSANLKLLADTSTQAKQYNLLIGLSRKSWIGRTLEIDNPIKRDPPSKMMEIAQAMAGAKMIRTHNVKHLHTLRRLWLREP